MLRLGLPNAAVGMMSAVTVVGPPGRREGRADCVGACVEHFGEGEPYLPLLDALGHLSRGPDHREVVDAFRRYAPRWLVQWPGLLSETELQRLQHQL
jgi:hypothetical protein